MRLLRFTLQRSLTRLYLNPITPPTQSSSREEHFIQVLFLHGLAAARAVRVCFLLSASPEKLEPTPVARRVPALRRERLAARVATQNASRGGARDGDSGLNITRRRTRTSYPTHRCSSSTQRVERSRVAIVSSSLFGKERRITFFSGCINITSTPIPLHEPFPQRDEVFLVYVLVLCGYERAEQSVQIIHPDFLARV